MRWPLRQRTTSTGLGLGHQVDKANSPPPWPGWSPCGDDGAVRAEPSHAPDSRLTAPAPPAQQQHTGRRKEAVPAVLGPGWCWHAQLSPSLAGPSPPPRAPPHQPEPGQPQGESRRPRGTETAGPTPRPLRARVVKRAPRPQSGAGRRRERLRLRLRSDSNCTQLGKCSPTPSST